MLQQLFGRGERLAGGGDAAVDFGNRPLQPAMALDQATAGSGTIVGIRRHCRGPRDVALQPRRIGAQPFRQTFESGEIMPPLLALPAAQSQKFVKYAHSPVRPNLRRAVDAATIRQLVKFALKSG